MLRLTPVCPSMDGKAALRSSFIKLTPGPPHAMEPSHATPSPALPTAAGENTCEMDVFDAAVDGATLLISLCGLVGNGAVFWLLSCRIRRNPVTVYVLNLAMADFTFLLFMLTYTLLNLLKDLSCSTLPILVKHLVSLLLLSLLAHNMGMYLLAAISIERCVSAFCSGRTHCHRPQHLSAVACALLWVLSITVIAVVTSLCLSHQQEQCRLALIAMYILNFLLFAPSMVISNMILLIKVLCSTRQRQHRRLCIVIFLTVLFFLLFGVPLSVWNFMQHFSSDPLGHHQVVFLLACINSSINPFIYVLVGSGRRHCSLASLQIAFQRVFEELGDDGVGSNNSMMRTLSSAP
ncbi:mas-related G-protein coupled receptor member H-like [Lagopus leucura]|uniref:mas-related G-protein coupled receptor member H-like n=1 Tax=Lagopus leucura TaxID=30410 RepID=UPI001C68536E|nr:mas-related G-protein coupled receptor member H-like [Lagopus leucura]